jgi:hypothetical protein
VTDRGKAVPERIKAVVDDRDKQQDRLTGQFLGGARNLHHRKLRSRGGENTVPNLITLSGSGTTGSHGWVHAHPAAATRLGFIVPSWIDDPADVPVLVQTGPRWKRWVRLQANGHVLPLERDEALVRMRELGVWGQDEDWTRPGREVPGHAVVQGR